VWFEAAHAALRKVRSRIVNAYREFHSQLLLLLLLLLHSLPSIGLFAARELN